MEKDEYERVARERERERETRRSQVNLIPNFLSLKYHKISTMLTFIFLLCFITKFS